MFRVNSSMQAEWCIIVQLIFIFIDRKIYKEMEIEREKEREIYIYLP